MNEVFEGENDEMFGALLNAEALAIRVFKEKSAPIEFHREAPDPEPAEVDPEADGPGP